MRQLADVERIHRFMAALGAEADGYGWVYFTGGATAVLLGWQAVTIDINLKLVPELDPVLNAIPRLKDQLQINVELASPADFIPVKPGWEDQSPFIARAGLLSFHHFDLYAQALAKLERSHTQDIADVEEMLRRGLIDPAAALDYCAAIAPDLYRYPAVDPAAFRAAVEQRFGPVR